MWRATSCGEDLEEREGMEVDGGVLVEVEAV